MTLAERWWRYNLVGVTGAAVQLCALAAVNPLAQGHYLWASAGALEITLLYNFTLHLRFTWRDRSPSGSWVAQLVRYQLGNGLLSFAGNLLLMRVLVHGAHLPVVAANLVAILCCSVANFALAQVWTFGEREPATA